MSRTYAFICKAEMLVAKSALFTLAFLVFSAALARTMRYPINWAMDVATFLFAWCVFLGADIAIREDRLFCIVIFTARLPQKAQLRLKILNYGIIAVFLAGMIGYGAWLSYATRLRTFQGIPGFSYTWVTLSVPIGCALMLVSSIRKIRELARSIRSGGQAPKDAAITEVI